MTIDMKDIVALCKRRGFIFQASDIYGGLNGFWDFGPLGIALKNNLRDAWWRSMVIAPPLGPDGSPVEIVGLDSAIIQNPKTWEASGHVGGFTDPMVDCKETKQRYRADHLLFLTPLDGKSVTIKGKQASAFAFMQGTSNEEIKERLKKLRVNKEFVGTSADISDLLAFTSLENVNLSETVGPDASEPGTLTPPRQFNLMLDTYPGVVRDEASKAYLRPETAQGIFLNYKNVLDSMRVRMPFGIAQVGKAFRNEVTPRNFIYRSREFEQMEMEWFCPPEEAAQWFDFWVAQRKQFWLDVGLPESMLQLRKHDQDELAHYAKEGLGTIDVEFQFPFTAPGFGELEGIAHRGDFDLRQHSEFSGQKLDYLDQINGNRRYTPHVIEPAAGLTRGVLALICAAYRIDPNRPAGLYLDFHPSMAPVKAAILPLTAKEDHVPTAQKLYMDLRKEYVVELDIKQNIGKRYARQDEIGTPFCFTIDNDTLQDQTVTVRERNSMKQDRIALHKVKDYLKQKIR
ncbi:MAG: glycine--tRNA ligase [Alphaproteobacteria bacterium]|nr:glycine--tRNA ligase [Alphaproteobacteria bacterium]